MVLSSVSTAVARTVVVEPALRAREPQLVGAGLHEEECDLRPEKDGNERVELESETRSEEELKP